MRRPAAARSCRRKAFRRPCRTTIRRVVVVRRRIQRPAAWPETVAARIPRSIVPTRVRAGHARVVCVRHLSRRRCCRAGCRLSALIPHRGLQRLFSRSNAWRSMERSHSACFLSLPIIPALYTSCTAYCCVERRSFRRKIRVLAIACSLKQSGCAGARRRQPPAQSGWGHRGYMPKYFPQDLAGLGRRPPPTRRDEAISDN